MKIPDVVGRTMTDALTALNVGTVKPSIFRRAGGVWVCAGVVASTGIFHSGRGKSPAEAFLAWAKKPPPRKGKPPVEAEKIMDHVREQWAIERAARRCIPVTGAPAAVLLSNVPFQRTATPTGTGS